MVYLIYYFFVLSGFNYIIF